MQTHDFPHRWALYAVEVLEGGEMGELDVAFSTYQKERQEGMALD
jgi:hypothetical protein